MIGHIKRTDTQIHHDVLEELKWDSRVDETEVGVEAMTGSSPSRARWRTGASAWPQRRPCGE